MDALINPLSLIAGALIASGVGLLTHWLERRSDMKKIKLKKIEVLYVLFKEFHLEILNAVDQCYDAVSEGKPLNIDSKTRDKYQKAKNNYYKISSLVDIYCPALKIEFGKFIKERNELLDMAGKLEKKLFKEFLEKRQNIRTNGKKLSEKIAQEARKHI